MKGLLALLIATLAATVTINVLLLGYGGGTPNDPVGLLSPVANLPQPNTQTTPGVLSQPGAHVTRPDDARPHGTDD